MLPMADKESQALDQVDLIQAAWRRERPDLDVTPPGIIGRIHRIGAALKLPIVALYAEYGLTEAEFEVLASLRRAGAPFERTPSEIAKHTMVTSGATTKRLDRLEAAGLVVRRVSDTDGRGRVVALTAEGRTLIDTAFTAHIVNEQRLLEALTPDQRVVLERILHEWSVKLEAESRSSGGVTVGNQTT